MKDIEDYIDQQFKPILNKNYVIEKFLSKNKKIIDLLYNEIFKNIECGNLQFIIDLNETNDRNIINIIMDKMNSHGWRCEYYRGDYRTTPCIKFTFIDLSNPDAQMVFDYYNK